jgi:translation initiation factor IF-3
LVDFGKYRYEKSKEDKEARKHQHANKLKEIQLSPSIDPHDFGIKLKHAVGFLCDEIKVKVTLKFRGREMAHKEIGFQVVQRFIGEVAPFGHPDAEPKLMGKGIVLMISPLPRAKRGKNPYASEGAPQPPGPDNVSVPLARPANREPRDRVAPPPPAQGSPGSFLNNPFANLDLDVQDGSSDKASVGS